jgi:hypothetical protein
VRTEGEVQAGITAAVGERFERQTGGEDVGAGAAVLDRDGQARQAEAGDLLPDLVRPGAVAVTLSRKLWCSSLSRKSMARLPDRGLGRQRSGRERKRSDRSIRRAAATVLRTCVLTL